MKVDSPRAFRKLRVSLTRSCNYACVYCAADGKAVVDPQVTAPGKFLQWIDQILQLQPIRKIRLTGGEPTVRKDLTQIARVVSNIPGIRTVALTTGQSSAGVTV